MVGAIRRPIVAGATIHLVCCLDATLESPAAGVYEFRQLDLCIVPTPPPPLIKKDGFCRQHHGNPERAS